MSGAGPLVAAQARARDRSQAAASHRRKPADTARHPVSTGRDPAWRAVLPRIGLDPGSCAARRAPGRPRGSVRRARIGPQPPVSGPAPPLAPGSGRRSPAPGAPHILLHPPPNRHERALPAQPGTHHRHRPARHPTPAAPAARLTPTRQPGWPPYRPGSPGAPTPVPPQRARGRSLRPRQPHCHHGGELTGVALGIGRWDPSGAAVGGWIAANRLVDPSRSSPTRSTPEGKRAAVG